MKILIGILVVVLAVFLNSVDLGTPLGPGFSFGPRSTPRPVPVPVPSGRRQTGRVGRGGRHGRQQSERTLQPVALPKVLPETPPGALVEASTSTAKSVRVVDETEEKTPKYVYIRKPDGRFIELEKLPDVCFYVLQNILIGRIEGDDIFPIFNKRHVIIRIDYNQNGLRIPMNETEARRWGVFGKYSEFSKIAPPAFSEIAYKKT